MSGILETPVEANRRFHAHFWWPTLTGGFYSFLLGTETFVARDMNGNIVLTLGHSADSNGSYFQIQTVDSTLEEGAGAIIPSGCWIKLVLSQTTTALYATQILTFQADFAPQGQDPFGLLVGQLRFTPAITAPEVVQL